MEHEWGWSLHQPKAVSRVGVEHEWGWSLHQPKHATLTRPAACDVAEACVGSVRLAGSDPAFVSRPVPQKHVSSRWKLCAAASAHAHVRFTALLFAPAATPAWFDSIWLLTWGGRAVGVGVGVGVKC